MAANIYMIARPATGAPALTNQSFSPLFKSWSTTDLMSLSVGNMSPVTIGSTSSSGRITFSPVRFTKKTDSNSPILLRYCAQGLHFDRVTFYVTKPSPATGAEIVTDIYVLGLVYVSAISNDVTSGDDVVTELITLEYGQFDHRVKTYSSTGTLTGFVETTWDMVTNTPWSQGTLDGPG
jgi:type VI protein secretion system component Hcp